MSDSFPPGPLCLALDAPAGEENVAMAKRTAMSVDLLKVGLTSFIATGTDYVRTLTELAPVFLDLKLHDIPAQVAGAVRVIRAAGASMTTLHAAGGADMMRAAAEASEGMATVAVTVLTSIDDEALAEIGLGGPAGTAVLRLTDLALRCGLTGVVCSPLEVAVVRKRFGSRTEGGPLLVVPGIRSAPAGDDQRRTLGAGAAIDAGADVVVVGRPITAASDPEGAAAALATEVRRG